MGSAVDHSYAKSGPSGESFLQRRARLIHRSSHGQPQAAVTKETRMLNSY